MTSRYFHLSKKIENIEKDGGGGGEREGSTSFERK